ncbi:MAG: T9SS type A sorting domain-containing protein [Bacteroidales bacterium]|nr:T9SS type A sorting domain-containing protein [Bacteroidales bacterium]
MKKLLIFFGLLCMINLTFAQQTVTIHQNGHDFQASAVRSVDEFPMEDIEFWVGSGSNSAVVIIGWDDNPSGNDFALAWGVRFNDGATAVNMLDSIAIYDNRVTYNFGSGLVTYIGYNDGVLMSASSANYWCYNVNGSFAPVGYSEYEMFDGDQMEISSSCYFSLTSDDVEAATDSNGGTPTDPVDASLPFNQILYWVGSGSNSAEFIVNFAQPDTAFAWGYRFDGTTTAQAMVDAIAAADPRFWTEGSPSVSGDIHFVLDNGDTLGLSPVDPNVGYNFWWTNLNGVSADAGASSTLHNGDVFKYGDMNSAIGWDFQYGYYMQEAWVKMPTPVTPPATPVEPDTLCTTIHPLTYSEDFASYTSDQSMRPYFAGAPKPDCWTVYSNGTVHHSGNGTSTDADYFGGVGYSTSTNSFGAIAANDAFFAFIASQIYTGNNTNYINDMLTTGTRRYAVLPAFDAPLSQTVLTFDHRTNIADANTHLVVGYIMNDTADFVALETYTADNKVLHHDTIHFNQYANVPADARLTLMWDVASTTASTTGPGNRYCGIDNLTVALDVADTTPVIPGDATIAADDILYWVGEGSESAIFVLNIDNTSVAWGYHFDAVDEPTVGDMLVDIDAADPRLAYTISWETYEYTFYYVNHPLKLMTDNFRFKVDGILADEYEDFEDYDLTDNTIVVVSNRTDNVWDTPIVPATVATMPVDATISASDIQYWVGTGDNEAVIAINWGVPDTALAWGLRFSGDLTVTTALQALVAAEDRLTTNAAMSTFDYNDGTTSLTFQNVTGNYMQFILNGNPQAGLTSAVTDGAFLKVGESAYGVGYDSTAFAGMWYPMGVTWPTEIHPVTAPDTTPVIPVPEEATIAASEILFWVGTGSNEAVMAVNWADTALAWGYRWDGTATVADMMNHIAAADPRFSFTGTGMVSDINYIDTAAGMTTPLGITPGYYWSSTNNGVMDWGMGQTLANGDFEKWADGSTGILVDSVWVDEYGGYWNYIYVYPMTIYPVTVPDTTGGSGSDTIPEHGPFCGGVGTEGCNAIAVDDNQFVAWATNVVLTRGPQDISNPNSPAVTFGDETNAIGPATPNNSMDAVSLGDGGSALVTFERPIQNGEGPDFAVFENDINGGFLELAFVEVSSDGVHFVRFPATSLTPTETQVGTFGFVDPTFINNLAGKFQIGYGTPFDLEELAGSENLNIDSIVYVRIVDVVGSIDPQYGSYDAFGHIVNDPWPTDYHTSGFDLTGVGVIHQKPVGIDNHEMPQVFAYPNPCNGTLYIINENSEKVELYNVNGQLLEMVNSGDTHITLNMQSYPAGLYLLKVGNGVQKILKK